MDWRPIKMLFYKIGRKGRPSELEKVLRKKMAGRFDLVRTYGTHGVRYKGIVEIGFLQEEEEFIRKMMENG